MLTSFQMRVPAPPLDAFVALIWICEREPERWAHERLLPGGSVEGRGRMQHHPAVRFALREFARGPHARTVADVSQAAGLNQRRFIELFKAQVGLTPKVYSRIRRFQRVIRRAHRNHAVNWSDLALDCGYFDQAHLIHDFEAFSGLTPAAWAAQRTNHVNHVPILD